MAQKIFISNFSFNMSPEEFKATVTPLGPAFEAVPGCEWKIWLIDEEKKEAGAVYLFKDDESLQTFKASPLVASVLSHPALSNFDFRERDILREVSEVTHAPLKRPQAALYSVH